MKLEVSYCGKYNTKSPEWISTNCYKPMGLRSFFGGKGKEEQRKESIVLALDDATKAVLRDQLQLIAHGIH